MILRRVIAHFRKQEWTAIGLDFLIVVVGVFVGLQVSNWNEDRKTDTRAGIFSARLADDLREEAWGYEYLIEYNRDVLAGAEAAVAALSGDVAISDQQFVIAAYRASQFKFNVRRRATYDELVSMGDIGLIADDKLRSTATRLFTSPMFDSITELGRASAYRKLFRSNTPTDVQRVLLRSCGDRPITPGDYKTIKGSLGYDCTLDVAPERIAAAATALRADPALLPALQLRFADVETALSELQMVSRNLRADLREIAGGDAP